MYDIFTYKKTHCLKNFTSLDDINYSGSCIYTIANLDNNKIYVGQTNNYSKRYITHKAVLKTNTQKNKHLKSTFLRGDNLVMSVLENCEKYYLNEREMFWIDFFKTFDRCRGYNLTFGGEGGRHLPDTPERKAKRHARKGIPIDNSHQNIPVVIYCAYTGFFYKEYESIKVASKDLDVSSGDISITCSGKLLQSKGFIFRYKQNVVPKRVPPIVTGKIMQVVKYNLLDNTKKTIFHNLQDVANDSNLTESYISKRLNSIGWVANKESAYVRYTNPILLEKDSRIWKDIVEEKRIKNIKSIADKIPKVSIRVLNKDTLEVLGVYTSIANIDKIHRISPASIYDRTANTGGKWERLFFNRRQLIVERVQDNVNITK
jgi:hypothetical protein